MARVVIFLVRLASAVQFGMGCLILLIVILKDTGTQPLTPVTSYVAAGVGTTLFFGSGMVYLCAVAVTAILDMRNMMKVATTPRGVSALVR
jgi:hypothetical protein